jgi:molybdopterin converting factor small subunit
MPTTQTQPTVTVRIPTPLRKYTDNESAVDVAGATVGEVLRALTDRFPDLKDNLFNESDELRQFVNVYVDDEDVRYLDGEDTAVGDAEELSIVPSIAGGN